MKKAEILTLIRRKEDEEIEYKVSLSQINEIVETVSAFANTKGGKIIVGVSNSGKIVGIDVGKDTVERLANKISQNTDPKVYTHISVEEVEGKKIIMIVVKASIDKLVLAFGRPYKRVGKSTHKMSKDEYERMILEIHKEKLYFDKEICKDATLKEIDEEFVTKVFIPKYELVTETKLVGSQEKLLEALGCVKNNKPTNGGILLFGKNLQKFYPNTYIALARYKGHEVGTERLDYKEFNGNIFQQIDECDKYIEEHIDIMSRLLPHRVEREDIPEYPLFSIRELITNAVAHRDYSIMGSKVIVKMFDNKIEFYNPGGLPIGITPENIIKKQFSRNPILARVLSKIRYIEEVGEGWDKIIKEHKDHPLKPKLPAIEADEHSVLVEIFSTKDKFEKEEKTKETLELNQRQKRAIEYIKNKGSIGRSKYMKINKVSHKTAHLELKELVEKMVFVQEGKGRATKYIPKR